MHDRRQLPAAEWALDGAAENVPRGTGLAIGEPAVACRFKAQHAAIEASIASVPVTGLVLQRASLPMATAVRTLDAILLHSQY